MDSEYKFGCETCSKMFKNKGHLKTHIDNVHLKKTEFKCDICFKAFRTKGQVKTHIENIHASMNKHHCSDCSKTYCSRVISIAPPENTTTENQCQTCGRCFSSKNSLKKHNLLLHERQLDLECLICEVIISTKHEFRQHMATVHSQKHREFVCRLCGKQVQTKGSLKTHMSTIHSDKREDFNCPLCPKTYISKLGINKHLTKRHSRPSMVKSRKPPLTLFNDLKQAAQDEVQVHPELPRTEVSTAMETKHQALEEPSSEPPETVRIGTDEVKVMALSLQALEPLEVLGKPSLEHLEAVKVESGEGKVMAINLQAVKSEPGNAKEMSREVPPSEPSDLNYLAEQKAVLQPPSEIKAEKPAQEERWNIYRELTTQESACLL